jgi:hypothetical protein
MSGYAPGRAGSPVERTQRVFRGVSPGLVRAFDKNRRDVARYVLDGLINEIQKPYFAGPPSGG